MMTANRHFLLTGASLSILLCTANAGFAAEGADVPTQLPGVSVEANAPAPVEGSAENGYRASTATIGALGNTPLKDVPYSVNVTSKDMINNLQAQTVSEALKYNPSVYSASGNNMVGGGAAFTIRGFTTDTNESFVDGIRMYSRTPLEDKERVEVLNGPSSFLYGFANAAGTINYVMKRPTDKPLANVTVGDYGGNQLYTHGDFGGPLDSEGKFAYRMNLLYVDKGDTGVKDDTHERNLGSGSLDWHATPDTLVSLDYSHYFIDVEGGDNIFTIGPNVTSLPKAPDASKNYMPPYSVSKDGYDRVATRLTSDINDVFSVRGAFAYSDVTMFRHRASDQITTNGGNYTMSRNYYDTEKYTLEGNAYVDAKFSTAGIHHKATLGLNEERTSYDYAYPYVNQNISFAGTNNLFNPMPYPADKAGATFGDPNTTTERTNLLAATLGDQITFDDHWSVLVGGTEASITDRNWDYSRYLATNSFTTKPTYQKTELTPSAALLFKPIPEVSTYVSYNESLQKGTTAPATAANANQMLTPYVAKQAELGAKATVRDIDINAAVFHIERAYAYSNPVNNIYTEDGSETHIGGELIATGKVTKNLTVTGGVTLLHATVDQTNSPSLLNKTPQGVPEKMARLYAEYAVPELPGVTLTGGVSYNGSVYVDAANTLSVPSVTTGDLGARFQTTLYNHDLTVRFNVTNVTNENYWATSAGSLALGEPRTFTLSTELSF
jgi:iron complex outermembrane receptor protein